MKKYIMLTAALSVITTAVIANNGNYAAPTPSYQYQDGNRCSGGQNPNTPGGYSLPKPDRMDQNYRDNRFKTDADRALYGQVMGALQESRFNDVRAYVSNGTVTLKGTVRTQQDRDDIDRIMNGMGAGGNIVNQVMVQNQ